MRMIVPKRVVFETNTRSFVEQTMKFADVIIPRGVENRVALDLIVKHVGIMLRNLKSGRK